MDTPIANKLRMLYILKILMEFSDEETPLSTADIISHLENDYGIPTHRTTIPKEIAALQEFGIDIIIIVSTQNKYFIASRQFELVELKLLVDAVESSKFITAKKSKELVSKITNLTSKEQAKKLKRNLYISDRIKPCNEKIYYIVDTINNAINNKQQIEFQYCEYTPCKKKILKNNGERYKISPYGLSWSGDFYYVFGYSQKHDKVVTFRVDRIADTPIILKIDALPQPKGFDIGEFNKRVFQMYDGEDVTVELQCDNSMMKTIIDRFGENVKTNEFNATSFKVIADVSASPTFFGWVFQFAGKIKILSPKEVKKAFKNMLDTAKEH